MDRIPVEFEHHGIKFKGHLDSVMGAGSTTVFHLRDDKGWYNGRLRMAQDKWVFDPTPKTEDLKELTDYFGDVVMAWYE